jgi:CubicO group peptidase (beta-lactamase class C family)
MLLIFLFAIGCCLLLYCSNGAGIHCGEAQNAVSGLLSVKLSCGNSAKRWHSAMVRHMERQLLEQHYPNAADPGACLVVVRNGEIIHQECRGMANRETDPPGPVTMETNFRLASVTKQFVAACILILRQRGELRLDMPLTTVFPDFPAYGKSIAIAHLLSHTSGLKDYEELLPADTTVPILDHGVLEFMKTQSETYFPAGSKFQYSNSGYVLLGLIVERVSGKPLPQFLEDNLFGALGMRGAVMHDPPGDPRIAHRAFGYRKAESGYELSDQSITSSTRGDGGIYCSPANYLIWHKALREGTLLPQDVVAESIMAARATDGEPVPYGLGWRLESHNGREIAYHPGSTTGFNHCVRWSPSEDFLLVLLANRSGAGSKELAKELEAEFLPAS